MGKYSDYYFQQNQIDINIAVFIAKKHKYGAQPILKALLIQL